MYQCINCAHKTDAPHIIYDDQNDEQYDVCPRCFADLDFVEDTTESTQSTTITLSKDELEGLLYAINRSDVFDVLKKMYKLNTAIALGLNTAQSKLLKSLKDMAREESELM